MKSAHNKELNFRPVNVERPIFLIGCERSGTTLLRLMLSHHPELAFHFESEFIIAPNFKDHVFPTGLELRKYHDWLRSDAAFFGSGFSIDESLSYNELVRSFIRQKAIVTGKNLVGMTIHKRFELLPFIWPEAQFIHLLRDGRDVSFSAMKMGWYGNEWAATERWKEAISSYDNLAKVVSPDNILEIRFECLVENCEKELKRISKFIGVLYDEAFFDFTETSSYNMPKRGVASDWRSNFNELTTQVVESEIGDLLQRFGYELSDFDPFLINSSIRKKLEKENIRLKRFYRIRKYGFLTIALNKLAENFHLTHLQSLIQDRIDRIDRDALK